MQNNQILANQYSGDVVKTLSPIDNPKLHYQIEGKKELIQYYQSPILANQVYVWNIYDDLIPLIFWIYEENINTNKNIDWAIVNPEGEKVFDLTLSVGDFTEIGNTYYWEFKPAIIEAKSKVYLKLNVDAVGISVLGTLGSLSNKIGGTMAESYP